MKLVIQGTLPSLNQYVLACRNHKYAGSKMKKDTEALITLYIKTQLKTQIKGSVNLTFRWYEPNKRRDKDNIASAKKFILDALVKNDILVNDNWQYVEGFTDEFYVDAKNPRIEVEINEVEL